MVMGMAEIKCCEDCVHIEVCAMCIPALPICDSFKDRTSIVEIVRCKDCIHWDNDFDWCDRKRTRMFEGDFCSYGERRSND